MRRSSPPLNTIDDDDDDDDCAIIMKRRKKKKTTRLAAIFLSNKRKKNNHSLSGGIRASPFYTQLDRLVPCAVLQNNTINVRFSIICWIIINYSRKRKSKLFILCVYLLSGTMEKRRRLIKRKKKQK